MPTNRRNVLLAAAAATAVPLGGATVTAGPIPSRPIQLHGPAAGVLDVAGANIVQYAQKYDSWGPRTILTMASQDEQTLRSLLADGGLSADLRRDATALRAYLLVMVANAAGDLGHATKAISVARQAAALATAAADGPTTAHAWVVISSTLTCDGQPVQGQIAARRAAEYAGACPIAVMALLAEAEAAASLSRFSAHAVLDTVTAAEALHDTLPESAWGHPGGGSLGTYHPANLCSHGGAVLARVGLHDQASARLAEAARILDGTQGGELVYTRLSQASVALSKSDRDTAAGLAASAVEMAAPRPAAWVAGSVAGWARRYGGEFAGLAEHTAEWGFPVRA